MATPSGGLPQGYSYMVGTEDNPGPHQACLHLNSPLRYYLGHGPLDGILITNFPGSNPGWKGPTLTPAEASDQRKGWKPDPALIKYISFAEAITYVDPTELLDWYTNGSQSKLFLNGVAGIDERARIAVAAIRAIEDAADLSAYPQSNNRATAALALGSKKKTFKSTILYGDLPYITPALSLIHI